MSKRRICYQILALTAAIFLCVDFVASTTAREQQQHGAKLDTQMKFLINDDELLLLESTNQQQEQQQLQYEATSMATPHDAKDSEGAASAQQFQFYRSELKRLSYETIHRILRDENEPVYRREDPELRYYQKRSDQPRHKVLRRSTQSVEPLQTLNLSRNALSSYDAAQQFNADYENERYARITAIDLSDNQLVTVTDLDSFANLQSLDLHNNSLSALPQLSGNATLRKLNLNQNKISQGVVPAWLQLQELHLSGNAIQSLNTLNVSSLSALETLDLSCNALRNLETTFFPQRMHNLKHLNLAYNQIGSIYRETFYNLLSLNTLLLRGNNISDIDYETFLALPNLQYLDLSHNQLHGSAIRALQGIPDLMGLSIAYNPEVGASMQEFVASWSLKELDASGTGLCRIPAALAQSVRTLKLTDNWLMIINCGDLDSYPLLQYLDLSHSHIELIEDDALGRLEILETLFLDHNQLRRIPLSMPTSLTKLFLQHNQIMDIQLQAFQGLINLQVLDLSGNKLLYLPALPLPKLLTLNVQASELKGVSQTIVHTLPRLRDLLLEDNPIKCSDLLGLAEWASTCRTVDELNEEAATDKAHIGQHEKHESALEGGVTQQQPGSKIDLKQLFVQRHNFFEMFECNCGLRRQQEKPLTAPTCANAAVSAAIKNAPILLGGDMAPVFVANEKITEVISLPSEDVPPKHLTTATTTATTTIATTKSMSKVKIIEDVMKKKSTTMLVVLDNSNSMPTLSNINSNSNNNNNNDNDKYTNSNSNANKNKDNSEEESDDGKKRKRIANNTSSLQTAKTLRSTEADAAATSTATTIATTTGTTSLVKQANHKLKQEQQQQMLGMPTRDVTTSKAIPATGKYANHVAIANETISLQAATNHQQEQENTTTQTEATTTTTTTTTQSYTTRAIEAATTAINSNEQQTQRTTTAAISRVTIPSSAMHTTPMGLGMGLTESALNIGLGDSVPAHISETATATPPTTVVADAIEMPQTISMTIKSGKEQHELEHQQHHTNDDETRSLLNQNSTSEPTKFTPVMNTTTTAVTTTKTAITTISNGSIKILDKTARQQNNDSNKNTSNNNENALHASLSDTSGQPTTTATIGTTQISSAPTTNAKITTKQQQKTFATSPAPPPHKHEPLQLHIKDRHLIGTPLLMHKGENILVDAEQLLLPGTATVEGNMRRTHAASFSPAIPSPTTMITRTTTMKAKLTPAMTSSSDMPATKNGKGNTATGDDILAKTQDAVQQHNAEAEAIKRQTNTHYVGAKLVSATPESDNEYPSQLKLNNNHKDKESKTNKKKTKLQPSLSIKKMTYSTKHATTTPTTTTAKTPLKATEIRPSHEDNDNDDFLASQHKQHNSVNTPNVAYKAYELNTFAHLKEMAVVHEQALRIQDISAHADHHEASASELSKSEQWLDHRKAITSNHYNHSGTVLLLSLGLVVVLLAGLIHVYRCDIPWRRHTQSVARPHRRQFNEEDAHSFLHFQGGVNSQTHAIQAPMQRWHHSTRREAPYSSPLHNLHVRELQRNANACGATQEKAQRCHQFYSASLNASSTGCASGTTTSSRSNSSSSSSSTSTSSSGLNCSQASNVFADESVYIEMTPDATLQSQANDFLPMELLSSGLRSDKKKTLQQEQQHQINTTTTTTAITSTVKKQLSHDNNAIKVMSNKLAPSTRRLGIW